MAKVSIRMEGGTATVNVSEGVNLGMVIGAVQSLMGGEPDQVVVSKHPPASDSQKAMIWTAARGARLVEDQVRQMCSYVTGKGSIKALDTKEANNLIDCLQAVRFSLRDYADAILFPVEDTVSLWQENAHRFPPTGNRRRKP